jgi:phenylpropionate dioxygenase-like ring-hydroxylating dioxygenase large terminal subunit
MSRDRLLEAARRTIAHAKTETVPLAETIGKVPAGNYLDPDRWLDEVHSLFHRFPLVLGFSCEFVERYSYRSTEVIGIPLLVTRAADDELRAFVNTCSHRGSQVVPAGRGTSRRFTCPYHAWSYDNFGQLVGILDHDEFGQLEMSCHGLTELPVLEYAGLVFVGLDHKGTHDLERYLCGYGEMLEHLGLAGCYFAGQQVVDGPNWKIAYDGYLDFYHLPILHRESFGVDLCNKAIYDAWGPHQRVSAPDSSMLGLDQSPESQWSIGALTSGIWTIFPHVAIASFHVNGPNGAGGGRMYMVSQLFPGDTPDTSTTTQTFLTTFEPTEEVLPFIEAQQRFLLRVVRDEDYANGFLLQRGLKSGAKDFVMFGRNEAGGQRFHDWVDRLVHTESESEVLELIDKATYEPQR